ncbi:sulfhydryl oxidase 2-like [Ischnura elegans]|uniref:sulfhydryl oxidase 2-like n=1 Tax=Ischnura elegans TaxID=197161 RepID=UPI001ED88587|nr:sulfhydryl oxidase 2-like [Ischnura elegans]
METVVRCLAYALLFQGVWSGIITADDALYTSDDKLTILNVTNFKPTVSKSSSAWIVEFYSSWCGFCKRFSPTWKDFAADINAWEGVISVGVVDCADDNNNPLCREYEIMRYPTLRMFSAFHSGKLGIELQKDSIDTMRHGVLGFLEKEQMEGRGSSWPNLNPYRSSDLKNLWKDASPEVVYVIIIFEEPESYIGREIILDLHKIKGIQVRRATTHNEALSHLLGVTFFPCLSVVKRDMDSFNLKLIDNTRKSFREQIVSFLESVGIADVSVVKSISHTGVVIEKVEISSGRSADGMATGSNSQESVYYQDLLGAFAYSLQHEIPLHRRITGEALASLQNYVKVLKKYFPLDHTGNIFVEKLQDWVVIKRDVQGKAFLDQVNNLLVETKFKLPVLQNWKGCRGSKPHFRGYPCSLWQMFHALTVNSVLINSNNLHEFKPLEVLEAMLGYITHFFGCEDCAAHFKQMAVDNLHSDVHTPDDSILWLWRAHNKANKRLKGDITEDPWHPKTQFPPRNVCPACSDSKGVWNEEEVLRFLKRIYARNNINYSEATKEEAKQNIEFVSDDVEKRKLGWDFGIVDISLCAVLYISSAAILILVYIKFVLRNRYKKKSYVFDILGKV